MDSIPTTDTPADMRAVFEQANAKFTAEWNQYLQEFSQLHAPVELTTTELHKVINCIENAAMANEYKRRLFDAGTAQRQLAPLKYWQGELEKRMAQKDPRVVPQEYEPTRKDRLMKSYFHAEEWSLSLFRDGQIEPEAELIRFK